MSGSQRSPVSSRWMFFSDLSFSLLLLESCFLLLSSLSLGPSYALLPCIPLYRYTPRYPLACLWCRINYNSSVAVLRPQPHWPFRCVLDHHGTAFLPRRPLFRFPLIPLHPQNSRKDVAR